MSLRFADGFDWFDNGANGSPSLKYPNSLSIFQQVASVAGRYGQGALDLQNSGFDEMNFTRTFSANTAWYAGFAFRPMRGLEASYNTLFFRLEHNNAAGTVIALRYNPTAHIEVLKGGAGTNGSPGTIVGTVASPLVALNTWVYWEVVVVQNGASSAIKIFADDVLVLDLGPAVNGEGTSADGTVDLTGLGNINRATFRWQSLGKGYTIDDYYVADNQGTVNNTRLGPISVVTTIPAADVVVNLSRNTGSSDASCVADLPWSPGVAPFGAPDGENTYLATIVGNEFDLWTVSPFSCTAKILGLALSADIKATVADQIAFLFKASGPQTTIGSASPTGSAYEVVQVIQETSLISGLGWVDGEINSNQWGASLSSGHISQYVLEKVLTLRNVAYTCGSSPTTGNSYAF